MGVSDGMLTGNNEGIALGSALLLGLVVGLSTTGDLDGLKLIDGCELAEIVGDVDRVWLGTYEILGEIDGLDDGNKDVTLEKGQVGKTS